MTKKELGKAIFEVGHIKGDFILSSGQKSNEYFDKYRFLGSTIGLHIAKYLANLIFENRKVIYSMPDYYGFLEMGAIPLSLMMLSRAESIRTKALFIRKESKKYGTCRMIEGPYDSLEGKEVVIIEDIVTTGGVAIEAAKVLRYLGAEVKDVFCIVDREADNTLEKYKLTLHSLFTISELKNIAK